MSNAVSAIVYKKLFGSATRKSVMLYFAGRACDDGKGIWASKATISAELELHKATVIRTINDLVSEGILLVAGSRKHRNGATIEYDISMVSVAMLPDVGASETRPKKSVGKGSRGSAVRPVAQRYQSHSATLPVAGGDPMGSHGATQTLIKPSMNLRGREGRGHQVQNCDTARDFAERLLAGENIPKFRITKTVAREIVRLGLITEGDLWRRWQVEC